MIFKALLIFCLGVLVGVFVIRPGKIGTTTAIIISIGFVAGTFLYQYMSPYQSCLRAYEASEADQNTKNVEKEGSMHGQLQCAKFIKAP